jgi:hypothetical protein
MPFTMTRTQMQGPPLSDVAFAEWFVDVIMPDMHPIPRRELTRVECLRKVKSARRYLKHFGFETTSHQGQVMSLMWMLAPNFFMFRPFSDILADPTLTPAQKVDALWAVDDAAMQLAEDRCDDRYWYPRFVPGNILGLKAYSEMTKAELWEPIDEDEEDPWSQFHDNDPQ